MYYISGGHCTWYKIYFLRVTKKILAKYFVEFQFNIIIKYIIGLGKLYFSFF